MTIEPLVCVNVTLCLSLVYSALWQSMGGRYVAAVLVWPENGVPCVPLYFLVSGPPYQMTAASQLFRWSLHFKGPVFE